MITFSRTAEVGLVEKGDLGVILLAEIYIKERVKEVCVCVYVNGRWWL